MSTKDVFDIPASAIRGIIDSTKEQDMSRRRGQQAGYVWDNGVSWMVQFREDARDASGEIVRIRRKERIGASTGPDRLSKREAERLAEARMGEVNRRNQSPSSLMTVAEFAAGPFEANVLWKLKPAGRKHYKYMLPRVLKHLGKVRLCDVDASHVEAMIHDFYKAGYGHLTLHHFKYCVSALFRLAKRLKLYSGENPAHDVALPENRLPRRRNTLTWDQAARVIRVLKSPYREMAILSMATSLNVAEMCGLRWRYMNLSADLMAVDGETLAPYTLAVRENFYGGEYGTLKTGARRRNVPLTPDLAEMLEKVRERSKFQGPEDPVFSTRTGTPVNSNNASKRHLRPAARKLGFAVEWHGFRRAHSSFMGEEGMPLADRMATMGHADARMTLHYDVVDLERRRKGVARVTERLMGKPEGGVQ